MHERQSIHGVPIKMVVDARTVLGNQFVGLRTQWWRMHECQSIHGAPNKMVEDARKVLGNQFVGLRIIFDDRGSTNSARKSIHGAPDSMVKEA